MRLIHWLENLRSRLTWSHSAKRAKRGRRRGRHGALGPAEQCESRILLTVPLVTLDNAGSFNTTIHIQPGVLETDRHVDTQIPGDGYNPGDFFADIYVDHQEVLLTRDRLISSENDGGLDRVDPQGAWNVDVVVDSSVTHLVEIQVRDQDDGGHDDIMDLSPDSGSTTFAVTVDPITGYWTSPHVSYPRNFTSGNGDGDANATLHFNITSDFLNPGNDADGDGIPNNWEVNGIDINHDGIIDFKLPNADPLHKDVYVETDAMQGRTPVALPPITSVDNSKTNLIIVTSPDNGLTTGTVVRISGVKGDTAANGIWSIVRIDSDRFALFQALPAPNDGGDDTSSDGEGHTQLGGGPIPSQGNGTYTGGGTWSLASIPTGVTTNIDHMSFNYVDNRNPTSATFVSATILDPYNSLIDGQEVYIDGTQDVNHGTLLRPGLYGVKNANTFSFDIVSLNPGVQAMIGFVAAPGPFYNGGGTWTLVSQGAATNTSLDLVVDAFNRIPVTNPDTQDGIRLHIEQDNWNLPLTSWLGTEDNGLSEFTALRNDQFGTAAERADPNSFNELLAKQLVYRYAVFADQKTDGTITTSSGEAYGPYGFAVTLGAFPAYGSATAKGGFPDEQAAAFMHELGHSLGLDHSATSGIMNPTTEFPDRQAIRSAWTLNYAASDLPKLVYPIGLSGRGSGANYFDLDDDEPTFTDVNATEVLNPSLISISDGSVVEGDAGAANSAQFEITLDQSAHVPITVDWKIALGGTASADDLDAAQHGSLTFLPGEIKKTFNVYVNGDTKVEQDETFVVNIVADPANPLPKNAVIYDNFGLGTIQNDDLNPTYTTAATILDSTYGDNGSGTTQFAQTITPTNGQPFASDAASGVAMDPEGRIVLFGNNYLAGGLDTSFKEVRLNPNGTLDTTFGTGGVERDIPVESHNGIGFSFGGGFAGAIYQTGDNRGKVIAVGHGPLGIGVYRLNLDGSPDTAFASNGYFYAGDAVLPRYPGTDVDYATSVAIYESGPDAGKILIGGTNNPGTGGAGDFLIRLNPNGTLDTTFGSTKLPNGTDIPQGRIGVSPLGGSSVLNQIKIVPGTNGQPDLIYVASSSRPPGGGDIGTITRVTAAGQIDSTFGINGTFSFSQNGVQQLTGLAVQPDGSLVVTGTGTNTTAKTTDTNGVSHYFVAARVTANGTLDNSFNQGLGYVTTTSVFNADQAGRNQFSSVGLQPNGQIDIAGWQNDRYAVMRLNPDGTPDTSFAPGATDPSMFVSPAPAPAKARAIAFAPNGEIIVAGSTLQFDGQTGNRMTTAELNSQRDDLSVTMASDNSQLLYDGTITYTLTVRNTGDNAVIPSLRDLLPANTTFVSMTLPSTSVNWVGSTAPDGSGALIATALNLSASDGDQVFTIKVRLNDLQTIGQSITNSVTVSSATVDSIPANNSSSFTDHYAQDLHFTMGSSNVSLAPSGSQVTFIATVDNHGSTTTDYTLAAAIPANSEFVSATGQYTLVGNVLTWQVSRFAPGKADSWRFTVRATSDAYLQATGTVTGLIGDATPSDNTSTSLSYSLPPAKANLVSYWNADGNANDSVGSNNGSLQPAYPNAPFATPATFAPGYAGQAYLLNGVNQAVSVADSPSLDTSSFTVSVNFNYSSLPAVANIIAGKPVGTSTLDSWGIWIQDGLLHAGMGNSSSFQFLTIPNSKFTPTANTWNQATLTFNDTPTAKSLVLYVNGVEVGSMETGISVGYDSQPILFGTDYERQVPSFFWKGELDEMYFFNRALTSTEVQTLNQHTRDLTITNLVPTISPNNTSVAANPGTTATISGVLNDPDGENAGVLVTASIGTVTQNPANPGAWNWSFPVTSVSQSQTVVITANDGRGGITSTSFALGVVPTQPPVGTSTTLGTLEDTSYAFKAGDFGFTDPHNPLPNNFTAVKISTLPNAGTLKYSNEALVVAGDFVSVTDLSNGKLIFVPDANANGFPYASFTFQVQDDGSTTDGGVNLDPNPKTMTLNVTSVSDAPLGTSKTLSLNEDSPIAIQASDFGFSDPNDSPADNFVSVMITSEPTAGSLTYVNGTVIHTGDIVTLAALSPNLIYTPGLNGNGAGYASFTFQVQDSGTTAAGGQNTDPNPKTMTFDVTSVNDAPTGTSTTVTTLEDTPYAFKTTDFSISDTADVPANALLAVKITTLPTAGSLAYLNGTAIHAGDSVSAADVNAGKLIFTPVANAAGPVYPSFTFQIQDDGGTLNGGVDTDPTPRTMTINLTSVNDAPVGTSRTVTTAEDTPYPLHIGDFGFTDPLDNPANGLQSVIVTTLPTAGSLTYLDGSAVHAGDIVTATDITNGKLLFTPAAHANGIGYASLTFQVRDDGGTANGGVDTDQTPRTLTIDVRSINSAPIGTPTTFTLRNDRNYTFKTSDFGFTDPYDNPANAFLAVKFTTLPTSGVLSYTDVDADVAAGDVVTAVEISAGAVIFRPNINSDGHTPASFTFQVQDDGGTAGGGVDTDPTPRVMTIDLVRVYEAPVGTSTTVTTSEDVPFRFGSENFGFSDPLNGISDNFAAVEITTLPTSGTLQHADGTPVHAGDFVTVAEINNGTGNLFFVPSPNANGTPYASFTFQVQDDGLTGNGNANLDPSPKTMTINVLSVNDAPSGTSKSIKTVENRGYQIQLADFGFTDSNDSPANGFLAVNIVQPPLNAFLLYNGVEIAPNTVVTAADINAGALVFLPQLNDVGVDDARFSFQVQDDGGTQNGGIDTDPILQAMSFDVRLPNNAPVGTSTAVTTNEDTAYAFQTSDFGFTDPNDKPGDALKAVYITTLPTSGILKYSDGTPAHSGDFVSATDIAAGKLIFAPAANANGAGYANFTFQVQDDGGGVEVGGHDLDSTPKTMTINVTSVNDAPVGVNKTITTLEDTAYPLQTSDFGITDPNDSPANGLLSVKITTLPTAGSLTYVGGATVHSGDFVSATDINAGKLIFTPAANANGRGYSSFTFQIRDDGGIQNGGVDTDPTPKTMTVNVTSVNDAPIGTSNSVTTLENKPYVFSTADFGFSDPNDTPSNNFFAVEITTSPGVGTLTDKNSPVNGGQLIPVADINDGELIFTPAPNASGANYTSFTFQVQDDGLTNNGGANVDSNPATMTINVTQVTLQVTAPGTIHVNENGSVNFTGGNLISVADAGGNAEQFNLTVQHGILSLNSNAGVTINGSGTGAVSISGTPSAVNSALATLSYSPTAGYHGAETLGLSVQDTVDNLSGTASVNLVVDTIESKLALNSVPNWGSAGSALSPALSVLVEDSAGNIVLGSTTTVTVLVQTGPGDFAAGSTTTVSAVNGTASFSNLIFDTAGTYTLSFSAGTLTGVTTSNIVVGAGAATHLAITQVPSTGVTGTALAPAMQVAVEDQFGNVVAGNSSTVTLTLSSGTFIGGSNTTTAVANSGIATFSNLLIKTVGTYTLAASDGTLTGATSGNISVTGPAAKLAYPQTLPTTGTAGTALSPVIVVAVEDSSGNVVVTNNSTVTLTLSSGTFSTGSNTATAQAIKGVATFTGLTINGAGTYTVTASDSALIAVKSTSITISPSTATQFAITAPTSGFAGTAIGVKLTLMDAYGNTITTDSSSTVTITETGPGLFSVGTTKTNTVTVTVTKGVAAINLALTTAGNYTLTASDGSVQATLPTLTITPNTTATHKLVFLTPPPTIATAGVAFNSDVVVAVEDIYNNLVTTDTSQVTLTIGTATFTTNAVGGIATFQGLNTLPTSTLETTKAGTFTPLVSDGTLTKASAPAIVVGPAAATQVAFISPTSGIAGTAFTVKVTLLDAYGNTVTTDSSSTMTISAAGPGLFTVGTTTVNLVSATVVKGVATFSLNLKTAGNYTLTASDGPVNGSLPAITVTPNTTATHKLVFLTPPPTTATAGVAFNSDVVVAVEDIYNNLVTTDTSQVTLTIGTATFTTNAVGGIATFQGLNTLPTSTLETTKAGTFTPLVSDGTLTKASAPAIVVSPSTATQFAITAPTSGIAGAAFTVKVTLLDAYGNTVTTDSTSTMTISAAGPGLFTVGATTANSVNATVVKGIATFSLNLKTAGNYTLTASDGSVQSALPALTITQGIASKLVFQTPPPTSGTAGVPFGSDIVVAVEDASNNIIATNNTQVTLTIGAATFTTNAVGGIATFQGLNSLPTSTLEITQAGTFTPTVTDGSLTKATAASITINPSTATQFAITSPTSGIAGTALGVKLTLLDAYGNTVTTDSSSTVTITETGPGLFTVGTTKTDTVTVTVAKGVAAINLALTTAGNYTLTASDGSVQATLPALTITPNTTATHKLVFLTPPPTTATAGVAFNSDVVVAVEDIYNNLVTTDTSQVTLTIGTATFTTNAVGGIATFQGLNTLPTSTLETTKAGTFTPLVSDGTLTKASAPAIVVSPAAATQVVLTTVPTTGSVGVAIGAIGLAIEDVYGNIVTSNNSTVTLSIASGPTSSFKSGATIAVTIKNGLGSISTTAFTAVGTYTIKATDGGLAFAISNNVVIS